MCFPAVFVCSDRGKYGNGFLGRRNLEAFFDNFKGGGVYDLIETLGGYRGILLDRGRKFDKTGGREG